MTNGPIRHRVFIKVYQTLFSKQASGLRLFGNLMVLCLWFSSCSTLPKQPTEGFPSLPEEDTVVLAPGDVIDVKFRYWPELNENQSIRRDGKISLQLVDDVRVTGFTPDQLDKYLTDLYRGKLKDPDISVIVRSLANQRVFVGGEVRAPGVIPLSGEMTVMDVIISAGGFINTSAVMSNVILVRHVDGRRRAKSIDLRNVVAQTNSDPVYVAPQDIIYVPSTPIFNLNLWIEQNINRIIPRPPLGFATGAIGGI